MEPVALVARLIEVKWSETLVLRDAFRTRSLATSRAKRL
jgi:hypothetical protein